MLRENWPSRTRAIFIIILLAAGLSSLPISGQKTNGSHQQELMQKCEASDQTFTEADCATWLKRADYVRTASCPDRDANAACSSFRELVKADDSDIMNDLAKRTNVYVCFRPEEDVFMDIYFSDPNDGTWERDGHNTLMAFTLGGAAALYYKGGIGSQDMSFPQEQGKWEYSNLTSQTNVSTLRVPFSDAVFRSDDIVIQGSRFQATESYKNDTGTNIEHTLILQLSTGRFLETYTSQLLGKAVESYSGRCLVLPPAAN